MKTATFARLRVLVVVLALIAFAAALAAGCGGTSKKTSQIEVSNPRESEAKVFTVEELAGYNGQNGQKAYVAVDGVVYDVTGSTNWPGGKHSPCNLDAAAGKDLSEVLKQAPTRMRVYISGKPVVGKLQGN